jgi:outer membrane protein assembly factor BamB
VVECARKEAKVSKLTKASCAACHGSSLEGLTGPSLTGPEFTARWSREDRSLESFYYILRMTMPRDDELWMNNRGVAIKDGRVFKGTADGYLIALDAADGHLLWARHVADPKLGETITMAPMVFKGLVLIGPAGSENNISGEYPAGRRRALDTVFTGCEQTRTLYCND